MVNMNKFLGACLLIAGCSIGAGMLGLPSVTGASGFFPSAFFFFLAWAFMAATGLVLAEVTLSFKKEGISFISMTENTLGMYGKISVWILFSLLFYAIQVAYFIGGGIFVRDFFEIAFGLPLSLPFASLFLGVVFFIII
jgi:tyrosine-specific transport protein